MNTEIAPPPLPELTDDRIAAMERTVFARIAADRTRRRARRGRGWVLGGAAAAVVVVAVILTPFVGAQVGGTATSFDASAESAPEIAIIPEGAADELAAPTSGDSTAESGAGSTREIVSSGSATVSVDDVARAAEAIGADARERGGYVESVSTGSSNPAVAPAADGMAIYPPAPNPGDGWIAVRVPADELDDVIAGLSEVGEVTTSTVSANDVTDQAIDLRARISAGETSVARLTELMTQAQSTADLIAAESALQERQATLEADRQQLTSLEGQVALASLSVQLVAPADTVEADPAGFGDGVAAGWNGLVATLNGLVIAFGFLLPWIAVIAVAGGIAWGVVRLVRRGRRPRPTPGDDA